MTGSDPPSFRLLLRDGARRLAEDPFRSEGSDPAFEAFLLFEKATGLTRKEYLLRAEDPAPERSRRDFLGLIARRLSGVPVQYLLGEWDFHGLSFAVGPGVLIPRPETELLCETACGFCRTRSAPRILDLCSGTGCLAVALAKAFPSADVTAVELYGPAFRYLERNRERHRVTNLTLCRGDALNPPPLLFGKPYDVILSNPPYLSDGDLAVLQREVRREPRTALRGGADGLRFYRAFTRIYPRHLSAGGLLAFEIGETEGPAVRFLFREAGLRNIRTETDAAGLPRVVSGVRAGTPSGAF